MNAIDSISMALQKGRAVPKAQEMAGGARSGEVQA